MTFVLLRTWRSFGGGDEGPFHCDDCCFVSRSYPVDTGLVTCHDVLKKLHVFNESSNKSPAIV